MTPPRLLIVEADGVAPAHLLALLESGRLPGIGELAAGGRIAEMDLPGSLIPGSIWPMLQTGRPYGDCGHTDFEEFRPEQMRVFVNAESDLEPFWTQLPGAGEGSLVLEAREQHPHPRSRADETCGLLDPQVDHRPLIRGDDLRRKLRGAKIDAVEDPLRILTPKEERVLAKRLVRSTGQRAELAASLVAGRTFALLGFTDSHLAAHYLDHHRDPEHWHRPSDPDPALADEPLVALDAAVARLAEPGDNLVVVAAKGARATIPAHGVLEELLRRAGHLRLPGDAGDDAATGRSRVPATERLRRLLPEQTRTRIATTILPRSIQNRLAGRAFSERYDWSRTRVFPVPVAEASALRINMRGRERLGVVEPQERKRLLDEIEALVRGLRDPASGDSLVERMFRLQEMFPGEQASLFPDLLVRWSSRAPIAVARHDEHGEIRVDPWGSFIRRPGHHDDGALVVAAGPGITPGRGPADASGFAATMLALAGVDPRGHVQGEPWNEMLRS